MSKKKSVANNGYALAELRAPKQKRKTKIGTLNVKTGRFFKMRRTDNPLKTVKDLRDWLYDATQGLQGPDGSVWTTQNLNYALRWLYACDQAEQYRCYTVRELAELLIDGIKPVTLDELQTDWLDFLWDEDPKYARPCIVQVLEAHFQVKDPYT